jgi:predicted molibdopterin-dependent oxidoreductase YjgC
VQRLKTVRRGDRIVIEVDGENVSCYAGDTVATAILTRRDHLSRDLVRPHSIFCAIGVCFECVAEIDGIPGMRTCMVSAAPGMRVRTAPEGTDDA